MSFPLFVPDKDFCCPVCCDIFDDPVILSCSHSFCKACLQRWWKEKQGECPFCRRRSSRSDPPGNLVLKNLCETFQSERSQRDAVAAVLCSLHGESLKLFCLDDQEPVCLVCRDSKKHTNHKFRPISEVALDQKKELASVLNPLQEKLKALHGVKLNCDKIEKHIDVQNQYTAKKIKDEFTKLHLFLQVEEEARMEALREEAGMKRQMMKELTHRLSRDIETLSDTVSAIKEKLSADDISLMQNITDLPQGVKTELVQMDPQLISGALIDVAKHTGNLTFKVWQKMRQIVPHQSMILDPNTAHPDLILSEDLTAVRWSRMRQELPDNPERFDTWIQVLGSEGFNSGTHSCDVEVGGNRHWILGMATGSVQRKGDIEGSYWRIGFYYGKYNAQSSAGLNVDLPVKHNLRSIRMSLDWDEGKLSYFDAETNAHLHTFTATFTESLYIYIGTVGQFSPLKILPVV